ncbi:MAG: tRNA lysidine(34) synthetase TilS [Planctomycetota bacterium]
MRAPLAALERELAPLAGASLLVAVSGGCDSVTLLHALHRLDAWTLHVLHVDHALRAESAADARLVQDTAARLGLPCTNERIPVAPLAARWGCGLEEAGRRVRLERFQAVAAAVGAPVALCAHHRDDQVETVLANCLRGADRIGQAGMAMRRTLGASCTLLRPWLDQPRAAIRQLAQDWGLRWNEDVSNADRRFRRNQLRHAVLPAFELGAPGFADALWAHAQHVRQQVAVLDARVAGLRAQAAASAALPLTALEDLSTVERRHCWRRLLEDLAAPITRDAVRRLTGLAAPAAGVRGARLHLGDWLFSRRGGQIRWEPAAVYTVLEPPASDVSWAGRLLRIGRHGSGAPPLLPDAWSACLDADAVQGTLVWRSARSGERWRSLGAPGSRSVLRWLGERGFGLRERRSVPLLSDAAGVLWVPGRTIAHRARVHDGTGRWLVVEAVLRDRCEQPCGPA